MQFCWELVCILLIYNDVFENFTYCCLQAVINRESVIDKKEQELLVLQEKIASKEYVSSFCN